MQSAQAWQPDTPALNLKVKFLRDLALSLLDELRDLGDNSRELRVEQGIDLYAEVSRFEIELIRRALQHTGGHQVRAARLLGLKTTTLNNKIKQYKIDVNKASVTTGAKHARGKAASRGSGRKFTRATERTRTTGARAIN